MKIHDDIIVLEYVGNHRPTFVRDAPMGYYATDIHNATKFNTEIEAVRFALGLKEEVVVREVRVTYEYMREDD